MPIVAETRSWAIALRFALAAIFAASAVLILAYDDVQGLRSWLILVVLIPALCAFLLGHRVRERVALDESGLHLTWSPLSVGLLPVIRREASVPWNRVSYLRREHTAYPGPRQYVIGLDVGRRRLLLWRLGRFTSNTEAIITALAVQLDAHALDGEVLEEVRTWQMRGAV